MKRFPTLMWTCFLILIVAPTLTVLGDMACPEIVRQALNSTNQLCDSTRRNQACYGFINVQAEAQSGIEDFLFEKPGDKTGVDEIQSMRLSPMEVEQGLWGVALMRLQASLPDSDSGNITLLTFGDVHLENAVLPATEVSVTTTTYANVREFPNTQAAVVASLPRAATVTAFERLADESWLRVRLPESSVAGWVSAALLEASDISSLNMADARQPDYRPMQAFYFESGSDQSSCAEVPPDGLLIQTPEGQAEVQLWINEVKIQMGSTVFFEAQPGGQMTVSTLEGHARVEAMGTAYTAFAGTSVSIPLGSDMKPTAPPGLPVAYSQDILQKLPLALLERPITVHAPLLPEEIQATIQSDAISTNISTVVQPETGQQSDQSASCPGNSCHDQCPGNSCHDQCPGNSCNSNGNGNPNGGNGGGNGNGNGNGGGKP